MKVRLLEQISGTRDGAPWPAPGTEVEVSDSEGRSLISGGSAEALDTKHEKVMVPPTGVHTPGTVGYDANVDLVAVPVDAVADREGTKEALAAVAAGDTKQVPSGTGVQAPTGAALTSDGVEAAVKADEQNAADQVPGTAASAPVAEKAAPATKSTSAKSGTAKS